MNVVEVKKNSRWLSQIIKLGDSHRATVGFLPERAFEEYAEKKRILALVDEDEVLAYVLFRFKKSELIIVHLCVSTLHRNKGYARVLIDELEKRNSEHISHMKLSCRRDYNLDAFWTKLGFVPFGESPGRATTKQTVLTKWIRYNQFSENLFTVVPDSQNNLHIILDTNVVIDLCEGGNEEVNALRQDYLGVYVNFKISRHVLDEINRSSDSQNRQKHLAYANSRFTLLGVYDEQVYNAVLADLLRAKPCDLKSNKWYDLSHIAFSIASDASAFVTSDLEWLGTGISEYIYDKYGLRIVSPGELIKYVDELDSPNAYSPVKLQGLDIDFGEMKQSDFSEVVNAFHFLYNEGRKSVFERDLRLMMAHPEKYKLMLVKSVNGPMALIVYQVEHNIMLVKRILLDKKKVGISLQNTLTKRLAFKLLETANHLGVCYIQIERELLDNSVINAFVESGYLVDESIVYRVLENSVLEPKDLKEYLFLDNQSQLNHAIIKYRDIATKLTPSVKSTIDLEKALWPLKINARNVPCFVVPIRADYAKELFDEKLQDENMSLFCVQKREPALSIENVYFKNSRQSIKVSPARILWYVSQSNDIGTGAIRATSYLDEVEIGTAKVLYKKYNRLGVLSWDQLKKFADDDRVAVYKFSYTELFDRTVELKRVRSITNKPNATFQSYLEINTAQYLQIYEEGKVKRIN